MVEIGLFLLGYFVFWPLFVVGLPLFAIGVLATTIVWHRRGVLHEKLFPGAFDVARRDDGTTMWVLKGTLNLTGPAASFVDSQMIVLAILGCSAFASIYPLIARLVHWSRGFPSFTVLPIVPHGTCSPGGVHVSCTVVRYGYIQLRGIPYCAAWIEWAAGPSCGTLFVLALLVLTLPPTQLVQKWRDAEHHLHPEHRCLLKRILTDASTVRSITAGKRSLHRRCVVGVLSTCLMVSAYFMQGHTQPKACISNTSSIQVHWVRECEQNSWLLLWLGLSLLCTVMILLWVLYKRPVEMLAISRSIFEAQTRALETGIAACTEDWKEGGRESDLQGKYEAFLEQWRECKDFFHSAP